MQIKITNILLVLSCIIFAGVCIEATGFIANTFASLYLKPETAEKFWRQADLRSLLAYDRGHFMAVSAIIIIVAVLRSMIFYHIIMIMYNKQLTISKPFNTKVVSFIYKIAFMTLGIGFFSGYGGKYTRWMIEQGVTMPDLEAMRLGGSDVWFFMGVTLLVIAQVFKKGIEIQSENDLTV